MIKRVLLAGLAGGLVLIAWAFVANAFFGLSARLLMNQVRDEGFIFSVLVAAVPGPGVYIVNPPIEGPEGFAPDAPVFSVLAGDVGHGAAGTGMVIGIVLAFVLALMVAGLMASASDRVLSRYWKRAAFVATIGLLLALVGDVSRWGIGGYPLDTALALGVNRFGSWVVVGLVMAWILRPPAKREA